MSLYDDQFDQTAPHQALPSQPTQPVQSNLPPYTSAEPSQPTQPYVAPAPASPYMPPPVNYTKPRRRLYLPLPRLNRGCLGCLIILAGFFVISFCGCLTATAIGWITYSRQISETLAAKQKELAQTNFQTAVIYDRNGGKLHELFGEGRRTDIKLATIPKVVIDATLATEDNSFYDNPGVDLGGVIRAAIEYVFGRSNASGGSTITQQLVRAIAFSYQYAHERSFQRKFEEIAMSLVLTRQMSKDQILELYLNQIYYGHVAYGIEAAAQTYFGKHAGQLDLAQAALLAGLPQAPAELDPLDPDPKVQSAVRGRQQTVLDLMVLHGRITADQEKAALAEQLTYVDPNVNLTYPHFTLYAEQQLRSLISGLNLPPSTLFTAGLSVYTTIDPHAQDLAAATAQKQISAIAAQHNAHNSAVIVLKPTTGEILAMVGSVDYNDASIQGKVNVTISPRQPGSSIKPLTYSSALEHGMTAASILWDVRTHIVIPGSAPYDPTNYDHAYHGAVRIRDALANSYNIPAVETLRRVGVPSLLEIAQRFGVRTLGRDASQYGLSLTLGGGDITLLEEAQAYAVLANGGQLIPATSIRCIVKGDGTILYQYEDSCPRGSVTPATIKTSASPRQVLDPRIAFIISDILADNAARSPAMGSRSPLYTPNLPTSVKTGTTNNFHDNWTTGFTRNVVVGVWVGNTDNKAMADSTGLTGAAPIWHDVMTGIYADPGLLNAFKHNGSLLADGLIAPSGLIRKQLCNLAGLRDPASACPPGRAEWFLGSPAMLPGPDGKLTVSGPAIAPTAAPGNGPRLIAIESDVVQILVQPLDAGLAASLVPPSTSGQAVPPPPLYCEVPNEVAAQVPSAQPQVFIRAPIFTDESIYAHIYAQNAGIPIEPQIACTADMLNSKPGVNVVARITAPTPGQTVGGDVVVSGVVTFSPQVATYFKVEIQGPQFPSWTTVGSTHPNSVPNGMLDHFGATGLQPGLYQLRITVVGVDGNYLLSTPGVPINITGQ